MLKIIARNLPGRDKSHARSEYLPFRSRARLVADVLVVSILPVWAPLLAWGPRGRSQMDKKEGERRSDSATV